MSSYEDELKADIEEAVHRMHVQDEARRLYSAASARIEPVALSNQWPRPEGVEYLISGLAPADGYILIPAERKAGKSTLVLNIIRALIRMPREPFLNAFRVHGRPNVAYFDMEMGWDRVSRWFDKAGLERGGKLYAESLRGRARAFDVLDDKVRGELAMQMSDHGIGVLFTDPLGPLLRAYNVDERDNTGVGRVIGLDTALAANWELAGMEPDADEQPGLAELASALGEALVPYHEQMTEHARQQLVGTARTLSRQPPGRVARDQP